MKLIKKDNISFLDRIYSRLRNNKPLALTWILIVSLITLGIFLQNSILIFNWFNSTFNEKEILYKKISLLNTKVNISFFISALGNPTIVKNSDKNISDSIYVFINKYYYIQANTDRNDNVKRFAVTSRTKDFNPIYSVKSAYFEKPLKKVSLNTDTYYKFNPDITDGSSCYYEWWPKGFTYIEGEYLGGDAGYQSLFVGINDSGYLGNFSSGDFIEEKGESFDCNSIPGIFRKENTFNTFMLSNDSSASAEFQDRMINRIGVNQFDINTLQ